MLLDEKNTITSVVASFEGIKKAADRLKGVSLRTPLAKNLNFSERYQANVSFKREDLQAVRSYKIRGAFNKIQSLSSVERKKGIVCASAGNHAQGVAYSCNLLGIHGTIFMPNVTPKQKINQVKMFGKDKIEIVLSGDTFDDAFQNAQNFQEKKGATFVHPFDDELIIEGQGTVALEILEESVQPIDYLFVPVGGGGLISGAILVFNKLSPTTKIIGLEPMGAPAMKRSLESGENIQLKKIDTFVDGAAVKAVGKKTLEICKGNVKDLTLIPEGKICTTILKLYNEEAIVVEPAGALSLAALDYFQEDIQGKNVVCIISGSNNDITRTEEIKERSLLFEKLKHYFMVRFPQRAGALKEFVSDVLGPGDDIVHFEYSKKHSREKGPVFIGIEIQESNDLQRLFKKMEERNFIYEYLNEKPDILQYLI
ncbi:MAG: threonine ammonia-lyase IlvA [Reichenbachiella sp.]